MTILATEDCAGTGALSANWTAIDPGISRVADVASVTGPILASARYTGVTFPDDQWAQLTVVAVPPNTDEGIGPVVRATPGGDMIILQGALDTRVYKRVSGSYTQLGTTGAAVVATDVLYIEVQGTTVIAKKNGTAICGSPIALGSGPASGSAGLWMTNPNVGQNSQVDDYSAGDFGGGATGKPWNYYQRQMAA